MKLFLHYYIFFLFHQKVYGGHYGNFYIIKNFQNIDINCLFFFSSAKKEGKVPDKGGHAVGLERYEILCRMEGKV